MAANHARHRQPIDGADHEIEDHLAVDAIAVLEFRAVLVDDRDQEDDDEDEYEEEEEISPEKKRTILEMLHIKIILSPERDIRLDGWFDPPPIDYRLLDPSSGHYAHLQMRFLKHV